MGPFEPEGTLGTDIIWRTGAIGVFGMSRRVF